MTLALTPIHHRTFCVNETSDERTAVTRSYQGLLLSHTQVSSIIFSAKGDVLERWTSYAYLHQLPTLRCRQKRALRKFPSHLITERGTSAVKNWGAFMLRKTSHVLQALAVTVADSHYGTHHQARHYSTHFQPALHKKIRSRSSKQHDSPNTDFDLVHTNLTWLNYSSITIRPLLVIIYENFNLLVWDFEI
jgi:hypothetical protein